mmetsp:Transcript_4930/g.17645  ORF Transcript_4930/g.17645 Transcript_4930/m.17645 type:complete len:489 (+) Transcript_4930:2631-4097(+)
MVAAGVDAAADVQVDLAEVLKLIGILVSLSDLGRQRQRAGIGQRAVVATGAGDLVGQQAGVGGGEAGGAGGLEERGQVAGLHPGQHQVLAVRDAQLAVAELVGQRGGGVHHVGARVARRDAHALEAERDRAVAAHAVTVHIAREPAGKSRVCRVEHGVCRRGGAGRVDEAGRHAVELGLRNDLLMAGRVVGQDARELLVDVIEELLPFGLDEDLDAGLVEVVAAAGEVVDPDDGFQVDQDLLPGHEGVDLDTRDRRAAHAAADEDLEADLAGRVLLQLQADVMPAYGRAVLGSATDGNLELARQVGELGVQGAPLAQDLAVGPRVDDLVGSDAGEGIARDVADAVAAGLDAVHVDLGQQVHHVGALVERDPVELQVLPRREVAIAAMAGEGAIADNVVFAGDARQLAQLPAAQLTVGDGHSQHRRMALHIPAVLQPQRAKVVGAELAPEVALELVAVLRGAGADEAAVEFGVVVHRAQGGLKTAGAPL